MMLMIDEDEDDDDGNTGTEIRKENGTDIQVQHYKAGQLTKAQQFSLINLSDFCCHLGKNV